MKQKEKGNNGLQSEQDKPSSLIHFFIFDVSQTKKLHL